MLSNLFFLIEKYNYLENVFFINHIDEYKCMAYNYINKTNTIESAYALHMPYKL